jgi:hypothetical protein
LVSIVMLAIVQRDHRLARDWPTLVIVIICIPFIQMALYVLVSCPVVQNTVSSHSTAVANLTGGFSSFDLVLYMVVSSLHPLSPPVAPVAPNF